MAGFSNGLVIAFFNKNGDTMEIVNECDDIENALQTLKQQVKRLEDIKNSRNKKQSGDSGNVYKMYGT